MKKMMLLALVVSANIYAAEVKLEASHIKGSSEYNGSILENEKKNVIVIRKEDIEKKQYPDIVSIFKDSPVTMVTHTQAGPLIALRGSGEKTVMRVNILLNGMSINTMDESMGVIPFNAIPVDTIEKIEIIPGGGLTLYGSGSSSGVINIVTNKTNKSSYGSVSLKTNSYNNTPDNINVSLTKGIKLNDKIFVDLAVEGQKGHGYRDEERHERVNALAGIDYKLNDKHKFRLEGMKYIANDKSTDELTYKKLKENRKGAGDSDFKVDSDRDSFTARYEYTPTKKWNISAVYNQSDFRRNIKQNNRPFLTFLPSEGFNTFFGVPKGYEADLVIMDVHNKLDGSIREKIKNFKFKTDYKYDKGNLIFGYDKSKHELRREMHINVLPFIPKNQVRYFLRPAWETVLDEELVEKRKNDYIYDLSMIFPVAFGFNNLTDDLDIDKSTKYITGEATKITKYVVEELESGMNDLEKNRILKQQLREVDYNSLVNDIKELREKYGNFSDVKNPVEFGYTETSYSFWKYLATFMKLPIKNFLKEGVTESTPNLFWGSAIGKPIKITDNMTVEDYYNEVAKQEGRDKITPPTQTSIVNSWVDVKKDTDSFYLYNDFDITDKLNVDAGLRYEKAKYNGLRHTDVKQVISVVKDEDGSYEANAEKAEGHIGLLTGLAQKNEKADRHENWYSDLLKEKMKELKETGTTSVDMLNGTEGLNINNKETETNVGGHLGINYKLNDTNTIYGRYERAFNSPLPTQFTNKTIDPRTKVKAYWESHIKSENMDNFELGFRGALNNNITYSVAGFMSNTHNEILALVKNGSSHMQREWRYINLEKTRRLGIELQSTQVLDKLKLKESFTYVSPKILSDDMERSTRQIYDDAIDLSMRNRLKWEQNDMHRDLAIDDEKLIYDAVTREDRKAIATEFDKIYENTIYKKIDETQAEKEVDKVLKVYRDKYAGVETYDYFDEVKEQLFGKWGDISSNLVDYKDRISEIYKDELDTAIKGKFLKKGDKIPLTPKVKATFSADYQFTDKFDLGTNFTYIGSYDSAEPVNGYGIKTVKVPHHLVADLYGTYRFTPNTEVKFGVNNVFNHEHYLRQDSKTATPAPGRTYSLGFTHRF